MDKLCPLLGKPCIEHGCKFYSHMLGANPQTGKEFDVWDCTFTLLPLLLIENSKMQRDTAAEIEATRKQQERSATMVAAVLSRTEPKLITGD